MLEWWKSGKMEEISEFFLNQVGAETLFPLFQHSIAPIIYGMILILNLKYF